MNIDLNNPLEWGRVLSMGGGEEYWVTFKYKRKYRCFAFNEAEFCMVGKVVQSRLLNGGIRRR